jgi:hypothetical protein
MNKKRSHAKLIFILLAAKSVDFLFFSSEKPQMSKCVSSKEEIFLTTTQETKRQFILEK